ncbi:hypothetical protein [Streptomyces sp. SM1]|uniref:hypothetical protein n=1 Tax=Streptomyces sp. SM1 TaxID=402229 RepID=UPI0011B05599|nr:hypothetical protein [Streptomyces sp. SM1]
MYSWQNSGWQSKLEPLTKVLYDYTKAGTEMQRVFQVLRWMRNTVHNEALDLMRDNGSYVVTMPGEIQDEVRGFLREGYPGWSTDEMGIRMLPPTGATATKWLPGVGRYSVTVRRTGAPVPEDPFEGMAVLDVRRFLNRIFPATVGALNEIMKFTPLDKVPGYAVHLENPSRVNLPWNFSDTTGHRLRMLYGVTELA